MTYSNDLKKATVNSYINKKTSRLSTISIFSISNGSLYSWLHKFSNFKSNYYKKHEKISIIKSTNNRKITPHIIGYIREYILKYPNFNIKILLKKILEIYTTNISKSTVYDIIKKLNIKKKKVYKKMCPLSIETKNELVKIFKNKIKDISHDNIISIDESSFDSHISHNYAWSFFLKKKGTRIYKIHKNNYIRYTVISAITNSKILNLKIIKGTCNGEIYKSFIQETIKKLGTKKKYYLLMDNARIHHYKELIKYMKTIKKCEILYNVPYTPELNPIERVFSKTKNILREQEITNGNLEMKIKESFKSVTSDNLKNYYIKSLTKE